jgi:hypothetical protein
VAAEPQVAGNLRGKPLAQPFGTIIEPKGSHSALRLLMTMLIMFSGFVAAIVALTYVEVRRIRKKLTPK